MQIIRKLESGNLRLTYIIILYRPASEHRFYLVFISDIILHMFGGTYVALVYLLMLNVNDI